MNLVLILALSILPIGDSITEGTLARPQFYAGRPNYRVLLAEKLEASGKPVEMLGPRTTCNWNAKGEVVKAEWQHHQGISGYRIFSGGGKKGYLETIDDDLKDVKAPDVVLLMVGTNDVKAGMTAEELYKGWKELLERLLKKYPKARFLTGSILDMDKPEYNKVVKAYNAKIKTYRDKRVRFVDVNAACPRNTPAIEKENFADWLHPNWTGHKKVADAWAKALR